MKSPPRAAIQKNKTIEYTYSRENIGVCHALNKARILVCTNYILYMNDDMYVCPNWDTYILDEINKQKDELFFFSSTVIEPKATSNCVIEKNYGTSIKNFDENSNEKIEVLCLKIYHWQQNQNSIIQI